MQITTVMAQLIVTDVNRSLDFYSGLFGRPPDANPMDRLYEWHFDDSGAIQVYEEPDRAGRSGVTIGVANLDAEVAALDGAGIAHEPLAEADYVRIVQIADPDLNRIVLTGTR